MEKKKLLYIHGYNGSPDGNSFQLFSKYMPKDEWQVIGMDHDEKDCSTALRQIRETIERDKIDLVVGSSLGGFLTLLTTGIQRIVINPCYSPSVELPKLGPQQGLPVPTPEMVATYAAYEPQLKEFSSDEKRLITAYFAEEDELLEDRYHCVYNQDIGGFYEIPGPHRVSEEAVEIICYKFSPEYKYLKKAHQESIRNKDSILRSTKCGCFSCKTIFSPSEATFEKEEDGMETAWCPYCGIDAVIGDATGFPITKEFLEEMNLTWF